MSFQAKIAVPELVPHRFTGGIAEGANLRTPCGLRRIEIVRAGDLIVTRNGLKPVQMVWKRRVTKEQMLAQPALAPIRLRPRAIGPMMPQRDLLVAPDHRLLIPGFRLGGVADDKSVLTEARKIAGSSDAIFADNSMESITYYQLVFEEHQVLAANGLPVESFLPDAAAIAALAGEIREELDECFPGLRAAPDSFPSASFPIMTDVDYLPFYA
ncbi:MAG: Hint domain-containing protein [Rhodobacteraceae bacterium]|nr:Hint domain-containing protein [Paracoccaceae bacterium]